MALWVVRVEIVTGCGGEVPRCRRRRTSPCVETGVTMLRRTHRACAPPTCRRRRRGEGNCSTEEAQVLASARLIQVSGITIRVGQRQQRLVRAPRTVRYPPGPTSRGCPAAAANRTPRRPVLDEQ